MQEKPIELEEKPLINVPPKKRTVFFIILYLLFLVDFISRVGINAIFPVIQEDLSLSDTEVGMMGSIVLLGMAVFVLPVSFWGEKHSPKKAITLSAFIWSIGSILSGMANSFGLLLMSRFFVGTGNSAYAPLSNSMITSMYCKGQWGKKIGFYNTAMTLGTALGALVFANLANSFGWRVAFYAVGIVSLLLTAASLALPDVKKYLKEQQIEATTNNDANKVSIKQALLVIGKNKALLGVCLGAGFASLVSQGILSWLSIYFVREMSMSISAAASLISVLALGMAFAYPLGGAIMDRWYVKNKLSRMYLPIICLIIGVVCFLAGFRFKLIPVIFVGSFILTLANTSYHVATQELVPSWFKSVSYGVYVLSIQLLGAVGPLLIGSLSEAFGLINALSISQMLLVLVVIIFAITSRVYLKDFEKARKMEHEAGIGNQ